MFMTNRFVYAVVIGLLLLCGCGTGGSSRGPRLTQEGMSKQPVEASGHVAMWFDTRMGGLNIAMLNNGSRYALETVAADIKVDGDDPKVLPGAIAWSTLASSRYLVRGYVSGTLVLDDQTRIPVLHVTYVKRLQ